MKHSQLFFLWMVKRHCPQKERDIRYALGCPVGFDGDRPLAAFRLTQTSFKGFKFPFEFVRQPITEFLVMVSDPFDFLLPFRLIDVQQFLHVGRADIQAGCVDGIFGGHEPDRRFVGFARSSAAFEHPLEHAAVFAVARP